MGLPIGADVVKDEILGGIMANVAETTEILLGDVERRLGERHEVCRKAEKRGSGGIKDIGRIQVKRIDGELHEVEDR